MAASLWRLVRDPQTLDDYGWKNERLSTRKRFLFMAAVGRHIAALMTEPECVRLVEGCEELAEGVIDNDAFSDVVSTDSKNVEALHGLGLAYMYLNDFAHAREPMEKAIADAQHRIKDFKLAIKVYQQAKKRGDPWPGHEKAGTAKEAIPA